MTLPQVLLLEGCHVNDATVHVLARSCKLLREVSIKNAIGCSDKSANVLLEVCPRRCYSRCTWCVVHSLARTLTLRFLSAAPCC
jgi:hypothetical protein